MSTSTRRARRARPLAVIALLVVAVLTAGCASIPTSGKIETTDEAPASASDPQIRVLARPPRAGATPTEVVAGFLTASASLENDHAFARSYLTTDASTTWRPDQGVAIYDSDPGYRVTELEPGKVRMLALKAAGSLDARGSFAQPPGNAQYRANFGVRKVNGQWRIATLPNGLILSTGDVSRAYRALNLFYLDIAGGVLVPDPVFLPSQQPGLPSSLTRQLLLGPTAWLDPAVRTAIPEGTRLLVDSVPVQDGIARVDLAPTAIEATGDDRRALAAQVTYTLSQLPDVTGVRITLGGLPFVVPGVGAVSTVDDWASFDPDASPADASTYTIDEGHLTAVGMASTPVPGYFGRTNNLTAAAVAFDGQLLAGVQPVGSGAQVRMGAAVATSVPVVHTGRRITSLSFDRLNQAWFADRSNGKSVVWAARAGKPALRVTVDGLGSRSIETLRVSRDGARVAMIVAATAGGPGQLLLGRIQRDTNTPVIAGLRRVENVLASVEDVSWADDTDLLAAGKRAGESVQAFTVGIDGDSVVAAGSVPSMQTVAACPGRPYLTGTAASMVWADRGNGWRQYVKGTVPLYPG